MEPINIQKGKRIISEGNPVDCMYVVVTGSITQTWKGQHITLGPGTIAGLSDALNHEYDSDYVVSEDSMVIKCPYKTMSDFNSIFEAQPVYIFGFSKGAFRQCRDVFKIYDSYKKKVSDFLYYSRGIDTEYKKLCRSVGMEIKEIPMLEELEPLVIEGEIQTWEHEYIDSLNAVDNRQIENIYGSRTEIANGVIGISCGYMKRAIDAIESMESYLEEFSPLILSQEKGDLFELVYNLRIYAAQRGAEQAGIIKLMKMLYKYISQSGLYDKALVKERWTEYETHDFAATAASFDEAKMMKQAEFNQAFEHICEFAEIDDEKTAEYRKQLDDYLALSDREGKEDNERKVRKKAVDLFYDLYNKTFFRALVLEAYGGELDTIIKMFLNLGYIDYGALGDDLTNELADIMERIDALCLDEHIFTIYTWLRAVYAGDREPSRNELDLDYRGFILEERKAGNIAESDMAEWMNNQEEKVKFEINNFFVSANRTTSGKMSSFCPVPTKEDFGGEAMRMLLTKTKLRESLSKIEEVDYGIFLREGFYTDMEANVKSEPYLKRVEPDIILLPNCGMRAMMWQECGGIKVDTPGRFVFPMFTFDDLDKFMIYCCGAFRWEICRKEQGSRWNDIGSDCLTSDFYDYFTFYRKNKDLSAENKEKVKTLLKSSRNNMREAFTKQYTIWVNFEAQGSIRLNKSERNILNKHCTFSKAYRSKVSSHPMFEQGISRHEIKCSQELNHLKTIIDKVEKNGGTVPDEVKMGMDYLRM
ncbi:Cyclic nucleotide-binding domain-containing protein [Pseudobutyrivibrio sp. ACV-2]|uniref:cyclic nucleotide-binding domain-containing protein n=1 Tax=Pseudobutyrivibrio sp. ACV-2 TaxID=1520801 RepID=UPI0008997830|nr:cyclic nucleotide-binding domain-containing protein [Pseudobutyrivibrio sp. ACV-2]SEA71837.1 Cyclic nucleotide-binding domain-containing protein [Pseudobutyrivibrio sp. ACV-2]